MQSGKGTVRRPLGIAEYLFAELRQGLQDIRQKVIEEGWFGRVVTAAPVLEMDRAQIEGIKERIEKPAQAPDIVEEPLAFLRNRISFDDLWAPDERAISKEAEQTHDLGIDL